MVHLDPFAGSSGSILAVEDGYPNASVARLVLFSGMTRSGQVPKISGKKVVHGSVSVPHIRIFNSPALQTLCGIDAHGFLWGFL